MEIENDFLIRPVQVRVALDMIQPTTSLNTLMQLNMVGLPWKLADALH